MLKNKVHLCMTESIIYLYYVAMKEIAEVRSKAEDDKEQQRLIKVTEVNKFQTQVSCC